MEQILTIHPVILSGGAGTRLWPVSRESRPKQYQALVGDQTLIAQTLARVADPALFAPPLVVGNADHQGLIVQTLVDQGLARDALCLLEPVARNSAPAIALAAHAVSRRDPRGLMLVMPSDHVIADAAAFHRAVGFGVQAIRDGGLITFGITPTGPETGYGYIALGEPVAKAVWRVRRFVEKPDRDRAAAMIAQGGHLWNAGIFLFRADTYLEALMRYAPNIARACERAMVQAQADQGILHPDAAAFAASPAESVDYAVMEKADEVLVVPVSMGWSDVGSWDAIHAMDADEHQVRQNGPVTAIDAQNCLFHAAGARIHAIGVSDLIVVTDGDDVLIVPRGQSQDVKRMVEALKAKGRPS